jgi:hypothetical protein
MVFSLERFVLFTPIVARHRANQRPFFSALAACAAANVVLGLS